MLSKLFKGLKATRLIRSNQFYFTIKKTENHEDEGIEPTLGQKKNYQPNSQQNKNEQNKKPQKNELDDEFDDEEEDWEEDVKRDRRLHAAPNRKPLSGANSGQGQKKSGLDFEDFEDEDEDELEGVGRSRGQGIPRYGQRNSFNYNQGGRDYNAGGQGGNRMTPQRGGYQNDQGYRGGYQNNMESRGGFRGPRERVYERNDGRGNYDRVERRNYNLRNEQGDNIGAARYEGRLHVRTSTYRVPDLEDEFEEEDEDFKPRQQRNLNQSRNEGQAKREDRDRDDNNKDEWSQKFAGRGGDKKTEKKQHDETKEHGSDKSHGNKE